MMLSIMVEMSPIFFRVQNKAIHQKDHRQTRDCLFFLNHHASSGGGAGGGVKGFSNCISWEQFQVKFQMKLVPGLAYQPKLAESYINLPSTESYDNPS